VSGLDALICARPENVLVLSGYWPVLGTAVAVATEDGVAVLAPEDERDLAEAGWAGEVRTYRPGSLSRLVDPDEAIREPLGKLLRDLGLTQARIGYEDGPMFENASYASMFLYGAALGEMLAAAAPGVALEPGMNAITLSRAVMTPYELERVHLACEVAGTAFTGGSGRIRPGMREPEVASGFAAPLAEDGLARPGVERAGGFTWCMSGPNSAHAGIAFARTNNRELRGGDLVLIHCNSYVDGYWTDITRTYTLGNPDDRQQAMYDAIFAARDAALAVIRPGVAAAHVDAAARDVLTDRGFGANFIHGLGHNVGFSSISAEFPPRLHPASPDQLEVGMTFNVEPSIYIDGYGGMRHCDVVALREDGPEVLTPFQSGMEELVIS
jgi:Xaa-Pro aminopeptidase/Xaa-Pro dipeptidase